MVCGALASTCRGASNQGRFGYIVQLVSQLQAYTMTGSRITNGRRMVDFTVRRGEAPIDHVRQNSMCETVRFDDATTEEDALAPAKKNYRLE